MRTTRLIRTLGGAALGVAMASGGQVQAFYWYGWPGGPPPPRTLVPPQDRPPTTTPGVPPDVPPGLPPSPLPEPGTALAALIGLGAVGIVRRWRNRRALHR